MKKIIAIAGLSLLLMGLSAPAFAWVDHPRPRYTPVKVCTTSWVKTWQGWKKITSCEVVRHYRPVRPAPRVVVRRWPGRDNSDYGWGYGYGSGGGRQYLR